MGDSSHGGGTSPLVEDTMFKHLEGCIFPHPIHLGFYKLIGHDNKHLMIGPSVQVTGIIGLFADSYESCMSASGMMFADGDVVGGYQGLRVQVCDMTSEQLLSRYTFRNGDRTPYVTVGSPDGSCYAVFANEGFSRNNSSLSLVQQSASLVTMKSVADCAEILCGHGYLHWALGDHSAALKAIATAYYGSCVDKISADPSALLSPLSESLCITLRFYWDNCSSISLGKDLSLMSAVNLLEKPFRLGGVGTGIVVTHVVALGFFPSALSTCSRTC